jgi:putative transposase
MSDGEEGGVRRRSKVVVFLHFVWSVKYHTDAIPAELERRVHRLISSEVEKLGGAVVAIGGMLDHIHLLVQMTGTLSPSQLMKQVKGTSSSFINSHRASFSEQFRWQDGYGCFSIGTDPESRSSVISYIQHQKEHHSNGTIIPLWEETGELVEIPK